MKIAIVLKGLTFMRSMGTLIYFAQEKGFDITIFLAKSKKESEHDVIDLKELSEFVSEAEIVIYESESDIVTGLKKRGINNVICQDASHHFPQLCLVKEIKVFSVSVFIDTLHYAWRVKKGEEKSVLPHKIYFPCTYIEDKFFSIGGFDRSEVRFVTLGSPLLDHALFVKDEPFTKSVVYIAPPPKMISLALRIRLKGLFCHIRNSGFFIIAKDRLKTPLHSSLKAYCNEIISTEELLPYASMKLISQADLHICGYSTSIFEARYLNKPTINLDINLSKASMPGFIANYGMVELYSSLTCRTVKSKLKDEFDALMKLQAASFDENKKFIDSNEAQTMSDNASIRILNDIRAEA